MGVVTMVLLTSTIVCVHQEMLQLDHDHHVSLSIDQYSVRFVHLLVITTHCSSCLVTIPSTFNNLEDDIVGICP